MVDLNIDDLIFGILYSVITFYCDTSVTCFEQILQEITVCSNIVFQFLSGYYHVNLLCLSFYYLFYIYSKRWKPLAVMLFFEWNDTIIIQSQRLWQLLVQCTLEHIIYVWWESSMALSWVKKYHYGPVVKRKMALCARVYFNENLYEEKIMMTVLSKWDKARALTSSHLIMLWLLNVIYYRLLFVYQPGRFIHPATLHQVRARDHIWL